MMWQEQLISYSILRSHKGCDAASSYRLGAQAELCLTRSAAQMHGTQNISTLRSRYMHSTYMWQEQLTSYSILRSHSGCDAAASMTQLGSFFLVKHEEMHCVFPTKK